MFRNPDSGVDFQNQIKSMLKNVPDEKSRDFFLMFMNSMEDEQRNQASRPCTLKSR
jgi:hypothetical protein